MRVWGIQNTSIRKSLEFVKEEEVFFFMDLLRKDLLHGIIHKPVMGAVSSKHKIREKLFKGPTIYT